MVPFYQILLYKHLVYMSETAISQNLLERRMSYLKSKTEQYQATNILKFRLLWYYFSQKTNNYKYFVLFLSK